MSDKDQQTLLVVVRHSPYGSSMGKVSVDTVLATAAFDCQPTVLYMGEGVLQLKPEQNAEAINQKTIGKQLASFPMYDVEQIYVEAEAAARYGLDLENAPVTSKAVNSDEIYALLNTSQHILSL
jgi:tRNA 2-thiouridine synthesizing protein C